MAENIPIHDESYPSRPVRSSASDSGWSLERLMRVSWGAIFAGFVVAFATLVLLILLGAAVGLTVFDPATAADGQGWGWAIWWIISSIVALFVGGLVAGRLAGIPRSVDSMLHGAATWALVIFASLLLGGTAMGQLFTAAGAAVELDNAQVVQTDRTQEPGMQPGQQQDAIEQLADTAAGVAWVAFFVTLLGALAAMGGGWLGTPEDIDDLRDHHHRHRPGQERSRYTPPPTTGEGRTPPPPAGA